MCTKRALQISAIGSAIALISLAACRKTATWSDNSRHQSGFVTANGVRLNYLDWRGSGPALILIHGIGDNPRDYTKVRCPALAFFAETMPDVGKGDSPMTVRVLAWDKKYMAPFRAASIERVKAGTARRRDRERPGRSCGFRPHQSEASGQRYATVSQRLPAPGMSGVSRNEP